MTRLETILFSEGDFNEKDEYIEGMLIDELMSVNKSLVMRIVEKCGKDNDFRIATNRRKGNNWNSLVEGLRMTKANVLFVDIYIQDLKTDTTNVEYFDKFFRKGEYYSSDNYLNEGVDYTESQKAEVMRSILLECVYQQFNNDVQKNRANAEACNEIIQTKQDT